MLQNTVAIFASEAELPIGILPIAKYVIMCMSVFYFLSRFEAKLAYTLCSFVVTGIPQDLQTHPPEQQNS